MSENVANSELKSLIETVLKTVGGLAADVRSNSHKLDNLESRFEVIGARLDGIDNKSGGTGTKVERIEAALKSLSSDIRVMSAQFSDVGVMAIKDSGRISEVEKRVDDLENSRPPDH